MGKVSAHAPYVILRHLSRFHEAIQHPLLGNPFHLDGILNNGSFSTDPELPLSVLGYGHYIDIDTGGESPIQNHFLFAVIFPFRTGGEIKKAEIDRFLDLVYLIPGNEDEGYVGLDHLHRIRPVGIKCRFRH